MREDFDFVTMQNYQADMAESTERGAAAINLLQQEKKNLRTALWLVLHAAGGSMKVSQGDIARFDEKRSVLEITDCPHDNTLLYTAIVDQPS